jgi:ubiquitin-activating enzyme E1
VVFSDYYNKEELIIANEICREKNIGFVYTGNLGLYGFAFIDYGNNHIIFDANGESVRNSIVVNITKDKGTSTVSMGGEDQLEGGFFRGPL